MTLSTKLSEVDDTVTEGANIDIIRLLNDSKKEFRIKFRQFKTEVKKGKSSKTTVDKLYKELIGLLDEFEKKLDNIPITLGSTIIGWFTSMWLDMVKWFIPSMLTFGIAAIVPTVKQLTSLIHGIIEIVNGDDDIMDGLHQFRQRGKIVFKLMKEQLTSVKKQYDYGKWDKTDDVKESYSNDDIATAKLFLYESAESGVITDELRDTLLSRLEEV